VEGELQRQVGGSLRAYRHTRGLSQEAFADLLGVHRTYMGGVERGERNLTLKSLERIADRLGLDPLALLSPEGAGVAADEKSNPLATLVGPRGLSAPEDPQREA
jgi:transcriptional regulator with XRE-family HTH domain